MDKQSRQEPKEFQLLRLIWNHVKSHSPDCRGCFPKPRKKVRKKKGMRICYDTRIKFWHLKAKMDGYKEQIDHLEFELEEALTEYEPEHNEGYD